MAKNETVKKPKITRRTFFDWLIRGSVSASLGYPILKEPNWPIVGNVNVPITGLSKRLDGLKIGLFAYQFIRLDVLFNLE